jgi:hypothetical protein
LIYKIISGVLHAFVYDLSPYKNEKPSWNYLLFITINSKAKEKSYGGRVTLLKKKKKGCTFK